MTIQLKKPSDLLSQPKIVTKKRPEGVLGLDISTKTGLAFLRRSVCFGEEILVTGDKAPKTPSERLARVCALRDVIDHRIMRWFPALVVIEGYAHASRFNNAMLAELGCAARIAIWEWKVPVLEVAPMMLKKFVSGDGSAKKDKMRLGVYKKWGFEHDSDNVIDAYGLARIGEVVLNGGTTKYEKDMVAKLKVQWS